MPRATMRISWARKIIRAMAQKNSTGTTTATDSRMSEGEDAMSPALWTLDSSVPKMAEASHQPTATQTTLRARANQNGAELGRRCRA